jgi:hypothetical protein
MDWDNFQMLSKEFCKDIMCPNFNEEKEECEGNCSLQYFAQWYYERGWTLDDKEDKDGNI